MNEEKLYGTAELLAGSADRLDGSGLIVVRNALKLDRHELAVKLETTERQIQECELSDALIPERLDIAVRKLFFPYLLS